MSDEFCNSGIFCAKYWIEVRDVLTSDLQGVLELCIDAEELLFPEYFFFNG